LPIYEAIFRSGDTEEPIFINTIEQHPSFVEVRKNIYCTFEDCEAKLEYVPKGKHKAYFKTWPKQDHTLECEDYFEREKKGRGTRNSATATMGLSDQHIRDILNDIKRKRKEKLNGSGNGTTTPRRPRNRPEVDPSLPVNDGVNINPTTGADATMQEGEAKIKAPPVRRRTLVLLNEDDIGFTRSLSDVTIESVEVESVEIGTERVVFTVVQNDKTCKVYFEEFFFRSSPVNFIARFEQLKQVVSETKGLFFSCVGGVVKRNDNVHLLVNKHSDFRVEDLYLTLFLDNYRYGR
jgi:hypothetical protein